MKFGVVIFPASNCDHDVLEACRISSGQPAEVLWHKDHDLKGSDFIVIPGGFSYGDYLRCGAIARFSPIMREIAAFAQRGGPVMGICNGFQILCEAGLLPGALLRNQNLKFLCQQVYLKVENARGPVMGGLRAGDILKMPIAHGDGNFVCDPDTLRQLEDRGQVAFRYVTKQGERSDEANPNGSLGAIAGITSDSGTVMGMMPHPDRAVEARLGSADGLKIFSSAVAMLSRSAA